MFGYRESFTSSGPGKQSLDYISRTFLDFRGRKKKPSYRKQILSKFTYMRKPQNCGLRRFKLTVIQICVKALLFYELIMRSGFHNVSVAQYQYFIGVSDR